MNKEIKGIEEFRLFHVYDGSMSEIEFYVSNLGRIKSRKFVQREGKFVEKIRKTCHSEGYTKCSIQECSTNLVHRMVASVFLDDYNPDLDVFHKNNDKNDNRPENLQMKTHLEILSGIALDRRENGFIPCYEDAEKLKLKSDRNYAKNKVKIKARNKRQRQNPEHKKYMKEYMKEYDIKNKEKLQEYRKEYYKKYYKNKNNNN